MIVARTKIVTMSEKHVGFFYTPCGFVTDTYIIARDAARPGQKQAMPASKISWPATNFI